jgi:5-methyltetrahydrofolate--homocysteine methyltransferase
MRNRYKENWLETFDRYEAWWQGRAMDRPLLWISAPRDRPAGNTPEPKNPGPPDQWLNTDYLIQAHRHAFETRAFLAETFPYVNANLGPGSLATYLGSEPRFEPTTVWYTPCVSSLEDTPLPEFNARSPWFAKHLRMVETVRDAFYPDAYASIPDLIESLDILAAMRGPTELLYDLLDRPAQCHRWLKRINDLYMPHYDPFYNLVKDEDGGSVFTAFSVWARGRLCKVQCDFSAMISPEQFVEFYVPYVREQVRGLDRVLYHLDGPDAIRHVDAILSVKGIHVVQWVAGAGHPHAGDPAWYPLYDKILKSGKGLEVFMAADKIEAFVRRFGPSRLFILTEVKTEREARELIERVRRLC